MSLASCRALYTLVVFLIKGILGISEHWFFIFNLNFLDNYVSFGMAGSDLLLNSNDGFLYNGSH